MLIIRGMPRAARENHTPYIPLCRPLARFLTGAWALRGTIRTSPYLWNVSQGFCTATNAQFQWLFRLLGRLLRLRKCGTLDHHSTLAPP